jgi:hypothetical protein
MSVETQGSSTRTVKVHRVYSLFCFVVAAVIEQFQIVGNNEFCSYCDNLGERILALSPKVS